MKVQYTINYNVDRHYEVFTRTFSESEIEIGEHLRVIYNLYRNGVVVQPETGFVTETARHLNMKYVAFPASDIASVEFVLKNG